MRVSRPRSALAAFLARPDGLFRRNERKNISLHRMAVDWGLDYGRSTWRLWKQGTIIFA